ncbi:MAG: hypothetical protein ACW7DS_18605 [Paraglaciecola chathamensis]
MKATLQKAQFATYKEANAMAATLDAQGIEHSSFQCGDFIVMCWAELQTVKSNPFVLYDEGEGESVTGSIGNDAELGLSVNIDGYGLIAYIEQYNGIARLFVYDDVEQDTPSHTIKLPCLHAPTGEVAA